MFFDKILRKTNFQGFKNSVHPWQMFFLFPDTYLSKINAFGERGITLEHLILKLYI